MEIKRKSVKNINVTIGGILISAGAGENDFVSVTSPERFGSKHGVQGDGVFYDMPNPIYEVTITTLETSEVNEDLQDLFNTQIENPLNGPYTFQLEDVGTSEELQGKCMITKEPDRAKTAEANSYVWTMHVMAANAAQYRPRGTA